MFIDGELLLTITSASNQPLTSSSLMVSAAAQIDGFDVSNQIGLSIAVEDVTTSFIGRTVIDDDGGRDVSYRRLGYRRGLQP